MKIVTTKGQTLQKIYERNFYARKPSVIEKVQDVLEDVRQYGDEAVIKYTKRFDKVKLTARQLAVTESEISSAFQSITSDFISTLKVVINNVNTFYKKQVLKPCRVKDTDGVLLKENIIPLDTVGIYVPAGTAPLVSSVYMSVIPAKLAGVKRIILATPPDKNGHINPHILAVANLLKVNEIYKIGGAQAIAAMAFGTKSIPRVDKIIGPGNMYVTEAKRRLFGFVDIDMLAGPSELAIIANRYSNPDFIMADMQGQAEHLGGLAILVTTSKEIIRQLKKKDCPGFAIYAKNIEEAIDIVNNIAPEHLQILTNNPNQVANKIKNAGAIFLGPYSPTALGDYAAGPSHVLPTMGSARFFSGLCVSHFLKKTHIISYSKRALENIKDHIVKISTLEGLTKHSDSIKIRFN
ncbi:MAG TPA: histidinol dehydrogenase [Candidatus Omnitrophota bacterium]|nr:histidinol dehydrogenase [Candidatus Omnitrophota bacterium]